MDVSALLHHLASEGEMLVGTLSGYHTVEDDWRVSVPSGLSEHLIHLVVGGACTGQVGGRPIHLTPGHAMWLPPRTGFALSSPDTPATLYRFRLSAAAADGPERGLIIPDAWEVRAPMDSLVSELSGDLGWRTERIRALLVVVVSGLLRLAERDDCPTPLTLTQRQAVEMWVTTHLTERPGPAQLAEIVHLSPDHFTRRFRETYGVPPKVWLVRRRMEHAAVRLDESDEPILRVAHRLGYHDGYLFSRQFKDVFGVSPRAWRSRSHDRTTARGPDA